MNTIVSRGIFLSQIFEKPIFAGDNKKIGCLKDVAVNLSATFPKVMGLVVDVPLVKYSIYIPLSEISQFTQEKISVKQNLDNIAHQKLPNNIILLKEAILDKQIVDVNDLKVVRVNDIKLIATEDGFRFVAVDCGLTGLLRGLHLLKICKRIPLVGSLIKEQLISWSNVQPLKSDMAELRLKVTYEKIFNLHPADIAEILSLVHHDERQAMIESFNIKTIAEVLPYLDDQIKANIIETMNLDRAVDVIEEMSTDEAVDILGDVSAKKADQIFENLEVSDSEEFKELLKHDDESAGGLMNTDFISFKQDLTVDAVLIKLRKLQPEEEMFYHMYIVDKDDHLLGGVSLQNIVLSNPEQTLAEIMNKNLVSVNVSADTDEIGELVSKYNLLALPVIDSENVLLGVITVDDVIEQFIPSGFRKTRDVMA